MTKFIHIKSGDIYTVIDRSITNATNGDADGQMMVLYHNKAGRLFVREQGEFAVKFRKMK